MATRGRYMKTLLLGAIILLSGAVFIVKNSSSDESELLGYQGALFDGTSSKSYEKSGYVLDARGISRVNTGSSAFLYILPSGGDMVYYVPETGAIMSLSAQGASRLLGTIPPLAQGISWSPDGKEFFAKYSNGTTYYNLKNGGTRAVSEKTVSPTFGTTLDRIAYIYFNKDTGEGKISISNPAMNAFKNIFPTRYTNWNMQWVSIDYLSLISAPNENSEFSSLSLLNVEESSLATLVLSKKDIQASWSPDGTKFVYSYYDTRTKRYELKYYDVINKAESRLELSSLASKCAWKNDGTLVFCAVPDSQILSGETNRRTNDAFYAVTTDSSVIVAKLTSPTDVDVSRIVYSSQAETLFFINKKNGSIYKLPLK